jgi:hypothetical protein
MPQVTSHFELFTGNARCTASLPANRILDDFKLIKFIKMQLPGLRTLERYIPFLVRQPAAIRQDPVEFAIRDINAFIARPVLRIAQRNTRFHLSADEISILLRTGNLDVTRAGWPNTIRLVNAPPNVGQTERIEIRDLPTFLSERKIRLNSGAMIEVPLNAEHIAELRAVGMTKVRTDGASLYLVNMVKNPVIPVSGKVLNSTVENASNTYEEVAELVLYMPYHQGWETLGYARGGILNSIALGPQEETTIELYTWDRVKSMKEEAQSVESSSMVDVTQTGKQSLEIMNETTNTSGWQVHGGVNFKLPIGGGLDFGGSSQGQVAQQSRSTHQEIQEAINKSSSQTKATKQTRVEETHEFGNEQRITRKLKNPNMCQTLTLNYFELLVGYQVTTVLAVKEIQLCVLAHNLIDDPFEEQTVDYRFYRYLLCHEGILRQALKDSNQLPGFDAARLLSTIKMFCNVSEARTCDGPTKTPPSTLQPYVYQAIQALQALRQAKMDLYSMVCDEERRSLGLQGAPPSPQEVATAAAEFGLWEYWNLLGIISPAITNAAATFMQAPSIAQLQNLLQQGAADIPQISTKVLDTRLASDPSLVDKLLAPTKGPFGSLIEVWGPKLGYPNRGIVPVDDAGLFKILSDAQLVASLIGSAPNIDSSAYTDNDIAKALVAVNNLACHIRDNVSYYRFAIWNAMDPDDQYQTIISRLPPGWLDYIENVVLGFVGNKAAMPLKTASLPPLQEWFERTILNNRALTRNPAPTMITVPTRAVTVEPLLSECGACEDFIVKHRAMDLEKKTAEVAVARERARQAELETRRRSLRLSARPPLLGNPTGKPMPIYLDVKQEKDTSGTGHP